MTPDIFYFQEVVLPILGIGTGVVSIILGYRFLVRWQQNRHELKLAERHGGAIGGPDIERLRAELEQVPELRHRLEELEERVDFAERLLAQRADPDRLAP